MLPSEDDLIRIETLFSVLCFLHCSFFLCLWVGFSEKREDSSRRMGRDGDLSPVGAVGDFSLLHLICQ